MSEESISLQFDEHTVLRRASLRLLPNVIDPESTLPMNLSRYKSSKRIDIIQSKNACHLIKGEIGYSLCRTNRGLKNTGKYYWEVEFTKTDSKQGHCRIGIASIYAKIEAPCGFDKFGYSLRDTGNAFHEAKKYNGPSFKVGDVVGFGLIIGKDNSKLVCWINGQNQTTLFEDIEVGVEWFPAISPYRDSYLTMILSDFKFFPGEEWTPASKHPLIPQAAKYDTNDLLKILKSGKVSDMSEEKLSIVNLAMIPNEELMY